MCWGEIFELQPNVVNMCSATVYTNSTDMNYPETVLSILIYTGMPSLHSYQDLQVD